MNWMVDDMIKGKKSGETFDEIGKRWYGFDFKTEKVIYCYLCCRRVKRKALRNLDQNLKFETYQQWNDYVCDKYQRYKKAELAEFSRYLNQMIRNLKPSHEYSSIVAGALTSVFFAVAFNVVFNDDDFGNISIWHISLRMILLQIFLFIPIVFCVNDITTPLFDKHFEKDFLKDYKEIIDNLRDEKMK